jgi:hypothetical protein
MWHSAMATQVTDIVAPIVDVFLAIQLVLTSQCRSQNTTAMAKDQYVVSSRPSHV